MALKLPFTLGYGEKLERADCYADLYLYPGGHFLMRVSVRSNSEASGATVNAGFALFDEHDLPVIRTTFGMGEVDAIAVPAMSSGFRPERRDSMAGMVPAELLERAVNITVCFRNAGDPPDWAELQRRASLGRPGPARGD